MALNKMAEKNAYLRRSLASSLLRASGELYRRECNAFEGDYLSDLIVRLQLSSLDKCAFGKDFTLRFMKRWFRTNPNIKQMSPHLHICSLLPIELNSGCSRSSAFYCFLLFQRNVHQYPNLPDVPHKFISLSQIRICPSCSIEAEQLSQTNNPLRKHYTCVEAALQLQIPSKVMMLRRKSAFFPAPYQSTQQSGRYK